MDEDNLGDEYFGDDFLDYLDKCPYNRDDEKYDLIEKDPRYIDIFRKIDKEVDELLIKEGSSIHDGDMGYCHIFWRRKQKLLKSKYNIRWYSPADLNFIMFD